MLSKVYVVKCRRAVMLAQLLTILVVGLSATSTARAEVPSTMSYQGRLTTPQSNSAETRVGLATLLHSS